MSEDTRATEQRLSDLEALAQSVAYAMRCGCLFPVPEPKATDPTDVWVKWGAMRNLHEKFAVVRPAKETEGHDV